MPDIVSRCTIHRPSLSNFIFYSSILCFLAFFICHHLPHYAQAHDTYSYTHIYNLNSAFKSLQICAEGSWNMLSRILHLFYVKTVVSRTGVVAGAAVF